MNTSANDILILGFASLDPFFNQGKIMALSGKDGVSSWDPEDINNPVNTGYNLEATVRDPLVNPLVSESGDLRILLAKIVTATAGQPSTATYTVLQPSNMDMQDWSVPKAENVTLVCPDPAYPTDLTKSVPFATNPHGLAQSGNIAYIGDYDSRRIFLLGPNELDGLTNTTKRVSRPPLDLGALTPAILPETAKGQSIIALQNSDNAVFVFALFVVFDDLSGWDYSYLVRLAVNSSDGSLSYSAHTTVGKNAQEMWAVFKGGADGDALLLVPAIGGEQLAGGTNGTYSNVCAVPAFGAWPAVPPSSENKPGAKVIFTGDPQASGARTYAGPKPAKDIRVAAASTRASLDAMVFIMAAGFTDDYRGADYRIYKTIVGDLFDLYNTPNSTDPSNPEEPSEPAGEGAPKDPPPPPPPPPPAISELVADNTFAVVREGQVYSSALIEAPYGVFYLGLLYENADEPGGERVLQFLGSALTIDSAQNYGARSLTFGLGEEPGHIGGKNVNSAAQLAETIRQYEKGMALKRGVKAVKITPPVVLVSGEEEEREDE